MKHPIHVSDHAVLRYLERAHGLDVLAVRRHLAGLAINGARLGAVGVTVEHVRLVLRHTPDQVRIVTALPATWPIRRLDP